ncbi:proteasome accessory factor PafA2 family protein [Bifidobacterium gallicum]|uniref:Proteasome accessory factor PafA n=1 Tax=Bifidobacterium gallicum DSM 20093 = LMG 11596 TaxID=561180 RepID=D1NU92_9BIFI|nr:proteasome accessory factor PafA2 family protein [Bifidobacterium gallicum]EFA23296.1 putative proteasome accessory factor PafA [Bifidobacterium gallicum DSM 20093 = LMG 11596]KFI58938.1 proteasome accessory factor PafA [Bifidobacterium gallicum DSM 20093 = LMG 11596]
MPQLHDSTSRAQGEPNAHEHGFDRIFGLETEYGVSVTGADHAVQAANAAVAMFRPIVEHTRSTNTYLANGSRLYLDVGAHPEYATAEARMPSDALLADAAGERIMRSMALNAQEQLRDAVGSAARIHLFKNNADSAGHSFGCHENYLVRRFVGLTDITDQLLPLLISRQIITGAGRFADGRFSITQRALFVDETVSSATTRSRPMVNTRDEPHANPEEFRRLHVIIGDSNRSQWATRMKLAITHLVLCVIEYHARHQESSALSLMALADPVDANHAVDEHGVQAQLQLASGDHVSALQMQRRYWQACATFLDAHAHAVDASLGQPGAALQILDEWRVVLDELERDDIASLATRVDWAAKLHLFSQLVARRLGCDVDQARALLRQPGALPPALALQLAQLDFDYHDIANGAVFDALVRHGRMIEEVSAQQADEARHTPPAGTRAVLRGRFVQLAAEAHVRHACDWTTLELLEPHKTTVSLLDPFEDQPDAQLSAIFDQLEARIALHETR